MLIKNKLRRSCKYNVISQKDHPPKHDPDRAIFNYSKFSLSEVEKLLTVKGLRFSFPPKKFNYADYLTNLNCFMKVYKIQMFCQIAIETLLKLTSRMLL